MVYAIVLIGVFTTLYSATKYKDILCPLNVFVPFFTVCTYFGSLAWYGKNQGSLLTYTLILISLITYLISFEIIGHMRVKNGRSKSEWHGFEYTTLSRQFLYFLAIISLALSLSKFMRALPFLLSGVSLRNLRSEYFTGSAITTSALGSFLDSAVNGGIRLALMIVAAIEIIFEKRKDAFFFLLVLLNVAVSSLATGGRLIIYDFAIMLLFSLLCYKSLFKSETIANSLREIRNNKKTRKYIMFLLVIGVISLITITLQRQASSETFVQSLYNDFTCFVPLMTKTLDMLSSRGDLTLGVSSFDGIFIIINIILAMLRLPQIKSVNTINIYDAPFLEIGGGNYANAYVSYIFYFYLDARIIGVVLGNILFGVMSYRIYKKLKTEPSKRSVAMYLFLNYLIFRTMVRWSFNQAAVFIALFMLLLIYKNSSASRTRIVLGNRRIL